MIWGIIKKILWRNDGRICGIQKSTRPIGCTRWRSWFRHCATSRKVAGTNSDVVIGIFHWRNPSGRTVAQGLTQPLTEMSTRNISWGVKRPVRRADNASTFMCRLSWDLGASFSLNPQCMSRPVMGLLYLLLDQVGMTEYKLALVKLSNCCCHSFKSSKCSADTESDLCPLTLIGFYPSLNTGSDFKVYGELLAVASRFLASNSQMLWSTTKSRKSCWPCDSCSASTCSALRLSHQVAATVV
jgi:hypothetical protein